MCSYLHKAPNGVYYFRMGIPADLRPFMGGKREIKRSLGLKDREAAKALIPDMTKAAYALLSQAKRDQAASKPAPVTATKSSLQIERERTRWEHDQLRAELVADDLFATDMEIERLEPVMDALAAGVQVDASPADIAKAGKLLVANERENAGALIASMQARYGKDARASEPKNQAVKCGPGKGIYLDTDIEAFIRKREQSDGTCAVDGTAVRLRDDVLERAHGDSGDGFMGGHGLSRIASLHQNKDGTLLSIAVLDPLSRRPHRTLGGLR